VAIRYGPVRSVPVLGALFSDVRVHAAYTQTCFLCVLSGLLRIFNNLRVFT